MLNLDAILESKSSHFGGKDEVVVGFKGLEKRQEFFVVSSDLLLRLEVCGGSGALE